jgi:hypothetical protein
VEKVPVEWIVESFVAVALARGQFFSPEEEDHQRLEADTRELVKRQQTEKN